jgi:predicted GNAT family acetyltransferase
MAASTSAAAAAAAAVNSKNNNEDKNADAVYFQKCPNNSILQMSSPINRVNDYLNFAQLNFKNLPQKMGDMLKQRVILQNWQELLIFLQKKQLDNKNERRHLKCSSQIVNIKKKRIN